MASCVALPHTPISILSLSPKPKLEISLPPALKSILVAIRFLGFEILEISSTVYKLACYTPISITNTPCRHIWNPPLQFIANIAPQSIDSIGLILSLQRLQRRSPSKYVNLIWHSLSKISLLPYELHCYIGCKCINALMLICFDVHML